MDTMQVLINGFVQGVGFRYFAMREATSLGITGYVRNMVTGEVEVVARADREILEGFLDRLRQGPSFSRVRNIKVTWKQDAALKQDAESYTQFTIR